MRMETLKAATGASKHCGWMRDEVAFFLHSLIHLYRPELVIQTGHLWGKSALVVLDALQDIHYGVSIYGCAAQTGDKKFDEFVDSNAPKRTNGVLMSMDPEPYHVEHSDAGMALLKQWYGESFLFIKERSEDVFGKESWEQLVRGKMIFGIVDGDHTVEGCRNDIESLARLQAECIFVDDTSWIPELRGVCEAFAMGSVYDCATIKWMNGVTLLTRLP